MSRIFLSEVDEMKKNKEISAPESIIEIAQALGLSKE